MVLVDRSVKRFDVYLVSLDPTKGAEIKKSRPCLIISPDEMNHALNTLIIAPMTSTIRGYPSRVQVTFQGKKGDIALDQIRSVDKQRLYKKLGTIHANTAAKVSHVLMEMFSL